MYKTIKLLSEENHVKINVKTIIKNKTKQLSIGIEDNGFGIGFKDHVNDMKRLGGREENSINGIDISVDTIEELVSLHQGEIIYSNKIINPNDFRRKYLWTNSVNKIYEANF